MARPKKRKAPSTGSANDITRGATVTQNPPNLKSEFDVDLELFRAAKHSVRLEMIYLELLKLNK